jgi:hypothetical protein
MTTGMIDEESASGRCRTVSATHVTKTPVFGQPAVGSIVPQLRAHAR